MSVSADWLIVIVGSESVVLLCYTLVNYNVNLQLIDKRKSVWKL